MALYLLSCPECDFQMQHFTLKYEPIECPECHKATMERNPQLEPVAMMSVDNGGMAKSVVWRGDIQSLVKERSQERKRLARKDKTGNAAQ